MMTIKQLTIVLITALSFTASSAMGQAFGIDKGASIGALNHADPLGNGLYDISVPSPHSEFESYVALATPETGVCMVRGIGINHGNDKFGQSIRGSFKSLESALESRYGEHRLNDFLRSGGIWDSSDEWVMAIRQNERVYQAIWEDEEGSDLPDTLNDIILGVRALSSDTAYIVLQYRFENTSECKAVIASEEESGL